MAVPTITSVDPVLGQAALDELVFVIGADFASSVRVTFGGVEATVIRVRTAGASRVADVRLPTTVGAGVVDVAIENLDAFGDPVAGESDTLASAFTFSRYDLVSEGRLTAAVRTLLGDMKRFILGNAGLTVSVDWDYQSVDMTDGAKATLVPTADLPSVTLSGPEFEEARESSDNVTRDKIIVGPSGPEIVKVRAPYVVDLLFDVIGAARSTPQLLNLTEGVAKFFNTHKDLTVDRDLNDPAAGQVTFDLDAVQTHRTRLRGGKDDIRVFTWTCRVRGFWLDDGDTGLDNTVTVDQIILDDEVLAATPESIVVQSFTSTAALDIGLVVGEIGYLVNATTRAKIALFQRTSGGHRLLWLANFSNVTNSPDSELTIGPTGDIRPQGSGTASFVAGELVIATEASHLHFVDSTATGQLLGVGSHSSFERQVVLAFSSLGALTAAGDGETDEIRRTTDAQGVHASYYQWVGFWAECVTDAGIPKFTSTAAADAGLALGEVGLLVNATTQLKVCALEKAAVGVFLLGTVTIPNVTDSPSSELTIGPAGDIRPQGTGSASFTGGALVVVDAAAALFFVDGTATGQIVGVGSHTSFVRQSVRAFTSESALIAAGDGELDPPTIRQQTDAAGSHVVYWVWTGSWEETDVPGLKSVPRDTSTLPQTTSTAFYTVAGVVRLAELLHEVTVQFQAQANLLKFRHVPDVGDPFDLCQAVDVTGLIVGSVLSITGDPADDLVVNAPGSAPAQATHRTLFAGTIEVVTTASSTGEMRGVGADYFEKPGTSAITAA